MLHGDVIRENELQNLLTDERSRCNQYKQIYQALKEEHTRLKEELTIIHQQLKDAVSQQNSAKSSNDGYIKKLELTVLDKQREIIELKNELSLVDAKELNKKIQVEERKKYEEELKVIRSDSQELQECFNNSLYEKNVLSSKLEYFEKEKARTIELLELQHAAEVGELKDRIEVLETSKDTDVPTKNYFLEFKAAEKEILQLTSRLNGFRAECEELRAQNENLTVQKDDDFQCNAKQVSEKIASIRALESEREISSMQKEVLRQELSKVQQEKSSLLDELQQLKLECLSAKNKLEDCKRDHNVNFTNLKIQSQQQKSELETCNERLSSKVDVLQSEIGHLRSELESERASFSTKEEAFQKNVVAYKQHHYKKFTDLEMAKDSLEQKLREMEITKTNELMKFEQKLTHVSQEFSSVNKERDDLQKEVSVLKSKLGDFNINDKTVFNELTNQNSEMHKEIRVLREKINELLFHQQQDNVGATSHKSNSDSVARKQVDYQMRENSAFEELSQLRLTLEQQKYQYQHRIDSLESHSREQQNIWSSEKKDFQAKVKQYGKLICKLRDRLDSHKTHVEELEVQNELLRLNVPVEEHLQLKDKLHELRRKQEEFHHVMLTALPLGSGNNAAELDAGTSLQKNFPLTVPTIQDLSNQDKTDKRKLEQDRSPRRRFSRIRRAASRRVRDYTSSSDIENTRPKFV